MEVYKKQVKNVRMIELNGISISVTELLIKGVPEGLLTVLTLHLFTGTKVELKKYLPFSLSYVIIIYFIRFLPITLGVNTMLSLLIMILLFQAVYRTTLAQVVRVVTSSVTIMLFIMISEVLNFFLLFLLFGEGKTVNLLNFSTPFVKSISTIPSTLFFALFVFMGYLVLTYIEKRKQANGQAGKKTGK